MKKKLIACLFFLLGLHALHAGGDFASNDQTYADRIVKTRLDNGLTILVCPTKEGSVVSVQLWYNVGSKHEKDGERGIAHFIEHMIFKGTKNISETDIPLITSKLSGYCNAATSYDYTSYVFDIPKENWSKILPVMADCMSNCTLRQDHLNSELKAVIQELKMGKDNYGRDLLFTMLTNIFESHPYHYPIIGFKQDLWSVSQESLLAFYKKYYTPDNAVMVVVGNVDPLEVHKKVEENFGHVPAGNGWNTQKFYNNEDVKSKSVVLYRDVQQSIATLAYVTPGLATKNLFELEALSYALANGKGSRLHALLVDKLQLVVDVHAMVVDLFDHSVLFVEFFPKKQSDTPMITDIIQKEIDAIAQGQLTYQEVLRAQRAARIDYQKSIQETYEQARMIGRSYLASQDHFYAFSYGQVGVDELALRMQNIAASYCSSVVRHQGNVYAIPEHYKNLLVGLQKKSDEEDTQFLDAKVRTTPIEEPLYASTVSLNEKNLSVYGQPDTVTLENGLAVCVFSTDASAIVECRLSLQADHTYDDADKQGLSFLVSKLLFEGTKNYPGKAFNDELELYGITMSAGPGFLCFTCLQQDTEKALSLLAEVLSNATITQDSFTKIKEQVAIESKIFWDTPTNYALALARQNVYSQDHPSRKIALGTEETIAAITLEDCHAYYKKMISPRGAHLAIVGDFAGINVHGLIAKKMEAWQGLSIEPLHYPVLDNVAQQEIISPAQRDQVVLAFTGLSIDRMHEDYDKILLFDQILAGSSIGGMNTRLFKLRMQSGLFYTIGGSLLYGATEQPGIIFIKTIVSKDRLIEAEKAILQVLDQAIYTMTQEELDSAKRSVITSFDMAYELNKDKVGTFLFLKKYNLPADYFAMRTQSLEKITLVQVQEAVKKILSSEKLAVIKIGRV